MPTIRCSNCKTKNPTLYRNVELEGSAWVAVEAQGHEDGSISVTEDDYAEDKQTEIAWRNSYGCADCGAEKKDFMELLEITEDAEIDPPFKFLIEGQETMDV